MPICFQLGAEYTLTYSTRLWTSAVDIERCVVTPLIMVSVKQLEILFCFLVKAPFPIQRLLQFHSNSVYDSESVLNETWIARRTWLAKILSLITENSSRVWINRFRIFAIRTTLTLNKILVFVMTTLVLHYFSEIKIKG